jgi:hypothetical protein
VSGRKRPGSARRRSPLWRPSGPAAAGALPLLLLAVLLAPPLLANGGTLRISEAPAGRYVVSVYSSPTPLRAGEVDISVLVQDSAGRMVPDVRVEVEAVRLDTVADPIRHAASRAEATNKLFQAAKFDVAPAGRWEFRIRVGRDEGGTVSFQATLTDPTLLDRPFLLALLILLPVGLAGWLLGRRERSDGGAIRGDARATEAG